MMTSNAPPPGNGIELGGTPGENNVIANNRHEGTGGKIRLLTQAQLDNNTGYTVEAK